MSIGTKLQKLRKEKGLSQEELADMIGVSRQSISKWELDSAYPETDRLIKLAKLYNVSIDHLLGTNEITKDEQTTYVVPRYHYEYKSKRQLFGLPLVHVNIGRGMYVSKGIISIGMVSKGFVSLGIFSLGIISVGVLGLGLISLGALVFGLLLAIGSISVGVVAIGAIAIGLFSIGALSIGFFSVGSLSIAKYVAVGDHAYGLIAVGKSEARGTYIYYSPYNKYDVYNIINAEVPHYWKLFIDWIKALV